MKMLSNTPPPRDSTELWKHFSDKVFFIEAAGILTFGVYWSVKSYELHLSCLESNPGQALEHAARRMTREAQTAERGAPRR